MLGWAGKETPSIDRRRGERKDGEETKGRDRQTGRQMVWFVSAAPAHLSVFLSGKHLQLSKERERGAGGQRGRGVIVLGERQDGMKDKAKRTRREREKRNG